MVVFNFQDFLINFGYFAIFALTLMRSLGITTILPIPQVVVLTAAVGLGLNPFVIGITAGLASTFGDTLAYFAGSGASKLLFRRKKLKVPSKIKKLLRRRSFLAILATSFTPLPLVFGLGVGSLHYNFSKFILASLVAKLGGSLFVAYGAFYGFDLIKGLG